MTDQGKAGKGRLRPAELPALAAFWRLSETLNFSATARALGVSPSALSQTIRGLEARLGVTLINRTTRQAGLTEAGEALLDDIGAAFRTIEGALDQIGSMTASVSGRLRLNVPTAAAPLLWSEVLAPFLDLHPQVQAEVRASDANEAVFTDGFDAGLRFNEDVEKDLVAFRVSAPFVLGIFASPRFLAERGRPHDLDSLDPRHCIQYRDAEGRIAPWLLSQEASLVKLQPQGRTIVNDAASNLALAVAGQGFCHVASPLAAGLVETGQLEQVLPQNARRVDGLYLYYPHRARMSAALRALIEFIKDRPLYSAAVMPPSTKTAEPVR